MKEPCFTKINHTSSNTDNISSEDENIINKKERKFSFNSSSSENSFNNLNTEIKTIIENETDLSFTSNANSELEENKENIDHLFDSKYWRSSKEINSETEEPISTYESQNDKDSPSKKDNFILFERKNSPKPNHSKYADMPGSTGMSDRSNKQSTQSNEDEETRMERLNNISYCESNNVSPVNSLINNEIDDNENKGDKIKINEEEKNTDINKKEKNSNLNNNINFNNKAFINGYNNLNNYQNFKNINGNKDSEYAYPYDHINYKNNNTIPFFPGVYLPQQLCSFIPNYNCAIMNKKNYIPNNNVFNKQEDVNASKKKEDFHSQTDNNINGLNSQYINPYMNDMNNYNKKSNQNQMDMTDLPLVINQNNPQNNTLNYRYPKFNFNMICCPQIPTVNMQNQKPVADKSSNNTNYLPDIYNKENTSNASEKVSNNANNTNNGKVMNNLTNICPLIEQNNNNMNNKIKINNKNFIINKNIFNNSKGNMKGEKLVLNLDDIMTGKDTRTTVMIRNIPIKYTDVYLTEALSEFNGKYDCLYMPYDYEKNGNKGYAFINFVNPLHILYFYEKFNGKKWVHFESSKICEINYAHFQGINEIQKHAKNYKGQKKPSYYSKVESNENVIIPSKYLLKLIKRFPKMEYTENKNKKIVIVKSFE